MATPLKTIVRGGGALLGALLLGGCAALAPHFEHPHLTVASIEVKEASLTEQHLRVRMRVLNPNAAALPIEGISYTIEVGGEELGRGVTADAFTVPAHGEAEFEMLMTTNLAVAFFRLLPRLKDSSQPLDYHLVGKVNTSMTFLRSIPFDERGTLRGP
jgi:LEA14-like dessication related protein